MLVWVLVGVLALCLLVPYQHPRGAVGLVRYRG